MNNRVILIICLMIFAFCTVFVLSLDTETSSRRVKITNKNVEISHEATEISNDNNVNVDISQSKITNKEINTQNKNVDMESGKFANNSDVNFENSHSKFSSQSSNFSSEGKMTYKNLDTTELDNALNSAGRISNQRTSSSPSAPVRRYLYKDIDWGTWKSNFVNQILDDSLSLHELDKYDEGSWFYYSFDVDSDGRISNIVVKSITLTQEDKDKVAKFLKRYQYKDITAFPPNSQRKKAKVSAVMMLSDTTKKANPDDFKDLERVKYQY